MLVFFRLSATPSHLVSDTTSENAGSALMLDSKHQPFLLISLVGNTAPQSLISQYMSAHICVISIYSNLENQVKKKLKSVVTKTILCKCKKNADKECNHRKSMSAARNQSNHYFCANSSILTKPK
jgi:hypothetical protein